MFPWAEEGSKKSPQESISDSGNTELELRRFHRRRYQISGEDLRVNFGFCMYFIIYKLRLSEDHQLVAKEASTPQ